MFPDLQTGYYTLIIINTHGVKKWLIKKDKARLETAEIATRNTGALNITAANWSDPVRFWSGNAGQNSSLVQMSDVERTIRYLPR